MAHGYLVALFDILGFEKRLNTLGLQEMLARYEALIDVVNYREEQIKRVFGDFGFREAPYWAAEGEVFIVNKIEGAYASDSILLWSNLTWPEARHSPDEDFQKLSDSPADGWMYHPIPCDNFLDICNDLMCRSLEVGLPLRGAIAVGDAILDAERNIFLGQPIVDAARLEKGHQMISVSFCNSAINQTIPERFTLRFDRHIKDNHRAMWGGAMLDWPRHWRRTRKIDIVDTIQKLDTDPAHSSYYSNTLDLITYSQEYADKFESAEETSIRSLYAPFLWTNTELALPARAVRRIPIEPSD